MEAGPAKHNPKATGEEPGERNSSPCDVRCGHGSHQRVSVDMIKTLCLSKPGVDDECYDFGKNATVFMDSLLKATPLGFQYGNSCFTDLIESMSQLTVPKINEILSVGSGVGLTDCYIAYKVLGARTVHLTDIEPPHDMVETLSCVDAIEKYTGADTLMFVYPCFHADGYEGVIRTFKGQYIVLVGEMCVSGHTNPGGLLEQISDEFDKVAHVDMSQAIGSCCSHESLAIYSKRS